MGNRQKKLRRIPFIKKNQISFLRRGIAIAWKREEENFFGFNHIFLQECLMWKSTFAPFTFRALPCNRDYLRDWELVHVVDEILTGPLQDCTGPYPRRMYINQSILMLELQPSLLGQIKTKSISLRQYRHIAHISCFKFMEYVLFIYKFRLTSLICENSLRLLLFTFKNVVRSPRGTERRANWTFLIQTDMSDPKL